MGKNERSIKKIIVFAIVLMLSSSWIAVMGESISAVNKSNSTGFLWHLGPDWNLVSVPMDPTSKGSNGVFGSYDALEICFAAIGDPNMMIATRNLGSIPSTYSVFQYGMAESSEFPMDSVHGYWIYTTLLYAFDVIVYATNYPAGNNVVALQTGWNLLGFTHNYGLWNKQPKASDFTNGVISPGLNVPALTRIVVSWWNAQSQWYNSYVSADNFPGMASHNWVYDTNYAYGYWIWVSAPVLVTFNTVFGEHPSNDELCSQTQPAQKFEETTPPSPSSDSEIPSSLALNSGMEPYPIFGYSYLYNGNAGAFAPIAQANAQVRVKWMNESTGAWSQIASLSNAMAQYSVDIGNFTDGGVVFCNATATAPYNNIGYNYTTVNLLGAPGGRFQYIFCGVPYRVVLTSCPASIDANIPFSVSYQIQDRDGRLAQGYYTFTSGPMTWKCLPASTTPAPCTFNGIASATPGSWSGTLTLGSPGGPHYVNISEGGGSETNPYLTPWGAFNLYGGIPGYLNDWANVTVNVNNPLPSFKIPVVLGWNLLSLPLNPASTTLPGALTDNDGDTLWSSVMWYDPTQVANHWKQYRTAWPGSMNDLKVVDSTMGLWIYITQLGDGYLNRSGTLPSSTSIQLRAGWNLVGYPTMATNMTIATAFWGTGVDAVEAFDPAQPYRTKVVGSSYIMKPGEGYWVHTAVDTVWTVDW
jgi:hypothetical protein